MKAGPVEKWFSTSELGLVQLARHDPHRGGGLSFFLPRQSPLHGSAPKSHPGARTGNQILVFPTAVGKTSPSSPL